MAYSFNRHYYRIGGYKETLAIALPMVVSSACDIIMSSIDRVFLSRLDSELMNAAMGGGMTVMVLFFFFFGIINFSTALVAQYMGAKQKRYSAVVITQALVIATLSFPLILLLRPLGIVLFKWMNLPEIQLENQIVYYNILVYGGLFTLYRTVFNCFFSGIGKTKIVMIATLVAMVSNVLINYMLIFGKFGFPAMGIRGAAIGTIIANAIAVLVLIFYYYSKNNMIEHAVKTSYFFSKRIMRKLLYYGFPQGLEMFITMLGFNIFIFIFQSQGNVIATATTITFNWDFIAFVPLIGIEIAITSLVGRYMGAGKPDIANRAVWSGIVLGTTYSFVTLVLFLTIPEWLVLVFKSNTESEVYSNAVPLAVKMIRLASLYVLFNALMVCFIGALRGAGDTHWTMVLSISLHWTLVAITYVLFNVFQVSVINVWLCMIVIILLFTVILYNRYIKGKWRNIKLV